MRIYKLTSIICEQLKLGRLEICYILSRVVYESVVNLIFLSTHYSTETISSYIAYSLLQEVQFYELISEEIKKNGKELPVETRMLKSINSDFLNSSIDRDDIKKLSKKWERSFKKRARRLFSSNSEKFYFATFALPSHSVHGDWKDALSFHLIKNPLGPKYGWTEPKFQFIEGLTFVMCIGLIRFIEHLLKDQSKPAIDRIRDIQERIALLGREHEVFLQNENSSDL